MADQGVAKLLEGNEKQQETQQEEGIKTVELLFKLGAECLERYVMFVDRIYFCMDESLPFIF